MRLLLTGSNGLIGGYLLRNFSNRFEKIYCLGRKKADKFEFINHDLRFSLKKNLPEVDVVLHLAAQTSVYDSEKFILENHKINTFGTINLLEKLKLQKNPPFFIFFGSATQVGYTNKKTPIACENKDNPITFYDLSKLCAERYLIHYINSNWIRGCSLRLCNVFGAHSLKQNIERGVIDRVFLKALAGKKISIYDGGLYIRDYIYIDDVISAIFDSLKNQEKINGKTFFLGSGNGTSIKKAFYTAINVAKILTKKEPLVKIVKSPINISLIEKRSFIADMKEFTNCTNWKPKYNLKTGLIKSYV